MLKVIIEAEEEWDDELERFLPAIKPIELTLEHSLISLSKWESKWKVPYLSANLTNEQTADYVRCMCLTQNVPDEVFQRIPAKVIQQITEYIADPMTATWFSDGYSTVPHKNGRMKGEIVTAEIVYYWMISAQIPMECQKWHLNRLLTLIKVISEKNKPPKNMSKSELTRKYSSLNAARRAKYHTKG